MNGVGIYYAYWIQEWDADFHPYIDKVSDLGFDMLEINAGTIGRMSMEKRRGLRSHAEDRGITLSYCVGLTAEHDLTSESSEVRSAGIQFIQDMAKGIGEMGGGNLGGILYGSWPATLPAGVMDKRPLVERSLESMHEAIGAAEDNNVTLCLEVVNRFEQYIMNTAAEGREYVEALASPNAKLLLDTFHMNIEEVSFSDAIETAGDYLGHLHIGENNRMPPGFGHLPWQEISQVLRKVGYRGDIVMEPFLKPGGQVGRDIRVYRDLGRGMDLDREAKRALKFVRELLEPTR
ncbi:MAG: TIM barrel protein [Anaerolineales bacterium]